MATEETFGQRCLRAAQSDVARCWEDYIDLVARRPVESDRNSGAGVGEDLRTARAALVAALAIERAALGTLAGEDGDDHLDGVLGSC